jgi:DNA-binding Lrp family transcriptional regulator
MSAIRRGIRPVDRFTMISNEFVRDARLSFAARGLGGYLLSHVEGWETNTWTIARANGIGRDQVRRLLRELEDAGYLRRERVRGEGGKLAGMVHEIQCTPWAESPSSDHRLADQALGDQALVSSPHKKTSPKDNIPREDHPSGGDGSAAPSGRGVTVEADRSIPEEEPMPTAIDPAQTDLFGDVMEIRPRQAGKTREMQGVQAVVAAYVTSWHKHNADGEPLKADKGRIARDAKRMLSAGEATQEELVAAAQELGTSTWANIATALKIIRRRGKGGKGGRINANPEWHPRWSELDSKQDASCATAPPDAEVDALLAQYTQAGVA